MRLIAVLGTLTLMVVGCTATPPAKKDDKPPAEPQPTVTYEVGKEITYTGTVKANSMGGFYLQDVTAFPPAVHVLDKSHLEGVENLVGKKLSIQGELKRGTMTVDGQPDVVYFMDSCSLLQ